MSNNPAGSAATLVAPEEEELRLAVLVVGLTDRVKQTIREIGEEMGLSAAQLDVLRQLSNHGHMPMSRLAEVLNCEASNLTGLVDKLEIRGLVERQADPADRRVRVLALTDDGMRASHEAWFAVTRHCPFMKLPREKRAELEGLLQQIL